MSAYDLDKFKGIFIALYSCFDEKGEFSYEAVKKLSSFYKDKGVKGLYICGSSGRRFFIKYRRT